MEHAQVFANCHISTCRLVGLGAKIQELMCDHTINKVTAFKFEYSVLIKNRYYYLFYFSM